MSMLYVFLLACFLSKCVVCIAIKYLIRKPTFHSFPFFISTSQVTHKCDGNARVRYRLARNIVLKLWFVDFHRVIQSVITKCHYHHVLTDSILIVIRIVDVTIITMGNLMHEKRPLGRILWFQFFYSRYLTLSFPFHFCECDVWQTGKSRRQVSWL